MAALPVLWERTRALCRGDAGAAAPWIRAREASVAEPALAILVCGGAYGFSIGAWRSLEQAAYCAVKLPLLLFATAVACAAVNALWAKRLGLALSFGESLRANLLSLALAALVLAAFAPVLLFFDRALPPPSVREAWTGHNVLGLAHVAAVAVAGSVSVLRQRAWLREQSPRAGSAPRVVLVWLALHLFVGAQVSWNLRPWFGSPGMNVEFLREHPFDGTFYESVFQMTRPRTR